FWVLSAPAATGATTLSVDSHKAADNFPIGSFFTPDGQFTDAVSQAGAFQIAPTAPNGTWTVQSFRDSSCNGSLNNPTGDTATVSVQAVTVTPAGNQTANEGALTSFNLGSFSDAGSSGPWSVAINWGDTSSTNFSSTTTGSLGTKPHTYADNGSYAVALSVTAPDSASGSASFTVTVSNLAPTATLSNNGPIN